MTDLGVSTRLTLLNRLLGERNHWVNAAELLREISAAYGFEGLGLRWPAEGPAILFAETVRISTSRFQQPLLIPNLQPGLLWLSAPPEEQAVGFWNATVAALGRSEAIRQFLAPVFDRARLAQRMEDAAAFAKGTLSSKEFQAKWQPVK